MKTSRDEIKDLLKAWTAISLAFALAIYGPSLSPGFLIALAIAAVTVGVGFVFHELSHKIVAQKFGCQAEFRSFDNMLILAILVSFLGFVFAAPGAVMISGYVTRKQNGIISAAGILANLLVAGLFLLLSMASSSQLLQAVSSYGVLINSWLALFNLIPLGNFDGIKVFHWNKIAYLTLAFFGLLFLFLSGFFG